MTGASQNKSGKEMKTPQVKAKKRDRSASEERLINAGLEIFSKLGYDGATTRVISKKADVNESLIGRYFDGKEGLLIAIVEKFIDEMTSRDLLYPPQKSLGDELELYVKERLQRHCLHLDFAKIIFSQAILNKKFKKRVREAIPSELDVRLISRIQLLADQKKLNASAKVEDICYDVDTYLDGMFFFESILNEVAVEEIIERTVRFVRTYSKVFEA